MTKRNYQLRRFRCPECGKEMYATKRGGHRTRPGHLKWLYCPWCHKTQNMVQVERGEWMYIPEFWIGFGAGLITEFAVLVAIAIWVYRKEK